MFTLGPFTFHLYGFMIGLACIVTITLIEKKAQEKNIPSATFWSLFTWVAIGSFLGARTYHLLTDYHLYIGHPLAMLEIWNGGLSIIGAVIGGGIATILYISTHKERHISLGEIADVVIFGLPFGQAIGRWGNYFNQELYGIPTRLPWGIYIDPIHRIAGYGQYSYFHPLFAYEMILTALFGIGVWVSDRQKRTQFGKG